MIDTNLRRRWWFGVLGIGLLTGILMLLSARVSANPNSTITLVSPNGGEAWAGGQAHSVVWTTTGGPFASNPVTLTVSWDGGLTWEPIASALPNSGSYSWTVPAANEPDVRVRAAATELNGNVISDASNSNFVVDSLIQVPGGLAGNPAGVWTNVNDFTLSWANPPDLSGIVGAYYKLDAEPAAPTDGTYVATTQPIIRNIAMPNDGRHSIYLWLKDRAGNVNQAQRNALFNVFWYDGTAPTTHAALSGLTGTNGWWRSTVTVNLTATDPEPGSGVTTIYYQLDGQPVQTGTTLVVSTPGEHQLRYWARDAAGNIEAAQTVPIRIDTVPPTSQATIDGSPASTGWYVQPVTVTIAAADDRSGVAGVRYRLDQTSWITGTVVAISSDGNHVLEYQAVDVAGNVQAIQSLPIPLDATPPTTAYQYDPNTIVGDNGWYRSPITITLIPTDLVSGVSHTQYRINNGGWTTGTQFVLSEEGEHTVEFYSTDVAGNVEIPYPVVLKIDSMAPAAPPPPTTTPGGWTSQNDFGFIWSKPNDRSGIAGAYYKIGSPPTANLDGTYTDLQIVSGIELPHEGSFDLYVWLRDGAGNVDYTRHTRVANAFRFDATAPATTAAFAGVPGDNGWFRSPVTVTLTVSDVLAGPGAIFYRVNHGSWQTGSTVLLSQDDKHTLIYYATDLAGNVETTHTATIRVDTTAPTQPQQVSLNPSSWTPINNFVVAWESPLDLSGVAGIYYKFGQPPNSPFDGVFLPGYNFATGVQVPGEGEHTPYIWLKDFAGNADHTQRVVLPNAAHYDATPPVTQITVDGTQGQDNWYVGPVGISLLATDGGSGVARTQYRINGSQWITGTQFTIGYDGPHLVEFRATDVAGNVEPLRSATVKVDLTPPVARITELTPSQLLRTFTIGWQGQDRPGSGIATYDVQVRAGRSGAWANLVSSSTATSATFTGDRGQTYYVRVRARDQAGNVRAFTGGNGDAATYISGVANSSFESANFSSWFTSGALPSSIVPPPAPQPPGSGLYSASLGSSAYGQSPPGNPTVPVGAAVLTQTVRLPERGDWPVIRLSLRYRMYTYDVMWSDYFQEFIDTFDVYVLSSTGTPLAHLLRDGNTDRTLIGPGRPVVDLGWKEVSFDVSQFAGQTVQIVMANSNRRDQIYNTWTIVDNITITIPVRRVGFLPAVRR